MGAPNALVKTLNTFEVLLLQAVFDGGFADKRQLQRVTQKSRLRLLPKYPEERQLVHIRRKYSRRWNRRMSSLQPTEQTKHAGDGC